MKRSTGSVFRRVLFVAMVLVTVILGMQPDAKAAVVGDVTTYSLPAESGEMPEICVAAKKVPGHETEKMYSKKDLEIEGRLCAIDFRAPQKTALCPKTWSTSPATIVYDVSGVSTSPYFQNPLKFESVRCARGELAHKADRAGDTKPAQKVAKFKSSMNDTGTSGTFSTSSIVYYHLSRYFGTAVKVPVAVHRTVNTKFHYDRVTSRGLQLATADMVLAGWKSLARAETTGDYPTPADLFTDSTRKQIYGMLVTESGTRYDSVINGIRTGRDNQNVEFQKTPAYLALRQKSDLVSSIQLGIEAAKSDAMMKPFVVQTKSIAPLQMVFWMRELTEIALLDFILGQQDRVGNIDYDWKWYYVETDPQTGAKSLEGIEAEGSGGSDLSVARRFMDSIRPPAAIAGKSPLLIQRTMINDNDAGVRKYANYSKTYKWIENLAHFNLGVYRRLIRLASDFDAKGPLYEYFRDSFGLDRGQFDRIVSNTLEARTILLQQCKSGQMKFDLEPKAFATGLVYETTLSPQQCDAP